MNTSSGIIFESLTLDNVPTYIEVGRQSYEEHYLHLWKNRDPTPYLETSFANNVVTKELNDPYSHNYLVKYQGVHSGILKVVTNQGWGHWEAKDALYLHRIYLLKDVTGKSIGKAVLDFTQNLALHFQKTMIWLEAMKKGQAKSFYQKHGYEIIGESKVELPRVLDEEKAMWVMGKRI